MTEPSRQLKAFNFSIELIEEMITEGWEIGTTSIVRCIHGLPQNARFEWCNFSAEPTIQLVFSHPTWPVVDDPSNVPVETITMSQIALTERRIVAK